MNRLPCNYRRGVPCCRAGYHLVLPRAEPWVNECSRTRGSSVAVVLQKAAKEVLTCRRFQLPGASRGSGKACPTLFTNIVTSELFPVNLASSDASSSVLLLPPDHVGIVIRRKPSRASAMNAELVSCDAHDESTDPQAPAIHDYGVAVGIPTHNLRRKIRLRSTLALLTR